MVAQRILGKGAETAKQTGALETEKGMRVYEKEQWRTCTSGIQTA